MKNHLDNHAVEFIAGRADNARLANLCGPLDENLRQIEQALDVTLTRRAHRIAARGKHAQLAVEALESFYTRAAEPLSIDDIQLGLVEARHPQRSQGVKSGDPDHPFIVNASSAQPELGDPGSATQEARPQAVGVADDGSDGNEIATALRTRRTDLRGRTPTQRDYLRNILSHDVTFGVGPAGTGKTYLAVACAVDALERDLVKRIVLTRPAVEAGERLGFLPGDLAQKVDPYLRPLYDALYDLLGFDKTAKMFERQMIEIAPLAYMRGRTLNHAFIILDEAQNTTPEQMKMFLTRIGFGSKAVVTGDTTQVDLPRGHKSGLIEAQEVLGAVRGIALTRFTSVDVVRHPLVARIVDAYEAHARQS